MSRSSSRFGSSRSAGFAVVFALTTPLLRLWLTTASRFLVAPPPCVFGATSRSRSRFESSWSAGLVVFFMLTTSLLYRWHGIASRSRTASPSFHLRGLPSLPRNRMIRLCQCDGRCLHAHDAAASSVAPSTAHRERVDTRRGCSAPARRGLLFWQSFFESSHSGRSRGIS